MSILSDDSPKVFEWTDCQQKAIESITDWSYQKNQLLYALVGSAGTGKSTVVVEILKHVKQKYGVCVSAPTHKAKDVIAQITGEDAFTIQKLLGLRPNTELDNFGIHNLQFSKMGKPKIKEYNLIIIDEASMLNKDLFDYLVELAIHFKTKILFVGDKLQLPPVQEDVSPALEPDNLNGISYLITPVRQKLTNPLNLLLLSLRCDIEFNDYNYNLVNNAIYNFDKFEKIDNLTQKLEENHNMLFKCIRNMIPEYIIDGEGYSFTQDLNIVIEQATQSFASPDFSENLHHCKFLTYNRVEVEKYSTAIRNMLAGSKSVIIKGELLTAYKSIIEYPAMTNKITNSEDYIATEVKQHESYVDEISGWEVTLESVRTGKITRVFIVNPDNYIKFCKKHRPFHSAAIRDRKKWRNYYNWKHDYLLLNNLDKRFNDKDLPAQDFGYIYGTTVHKSQGSTYGKVFVDGVNIGGSYGQGISNIKRKKGREATKEEKRHLALLCRRLMYVALSRASQTALIHL